ncbi:hypothetical protein SO802_026526 [Lithocarpus litseifolius]|uniref:DUF4283 domain-containing protein n=1 Tax=Lithocarpus litseifolius TaxID=425828 RepID=A0AAW2C1L6_9ROSI
MDSDFIERLQKISLTEEEEIDIAVRVSHRRETLEEFSLSMIGCFLCEKPFNIRAAKGMLWSVWCMGSELKIVEMWGLSFDLMNEEAGREIGSVLGKVVEVDGKAIAAKQAGFLRLKIDIPLDKPLRKGAFGGHDIKQFPHGCPFINLGEHTENPYGEWLKARGRQGMDGLRDQGRNTLQSRKEEGDGEPTRKPPFHASRRNRAESNSLAHETDLAEKITLLSVQEGAEGTSGPSTQLMGVDLTYNSNSERTVKQINGFFADKTGTTTQQNSEEGDLGDKAMCPHLGNTKEDNGHKAMHVEPKCGATKDPCSVNHQSIPHPQQKAPKWTRKTKPHDGDMGNSTEGKTNEDGEIKKVGSKRGHVCGSVESKTEDTENGKRLKTRKELTYRDVSTMEVAVQPR